MSARPVERHPFEPFLPAGAQMLFLGSFPPQPHRWCMPFYYPNWINDFWRIMGLIHFGDKDHFCLTPEKRFDEQSIRQFCTDAGLAFYDTACEVRRLRDNASDAYLEVVTPTDIPAILRRIPKCQALITTGEKATSVVAERFRCPVMLQAPQKSLGGAETGVLKVVAGVPLEGVWAIGQQGPKGSARRRSWCPPSR